MKIKTLSAALILTILVACNQEQPTGKIIVSNAMPTHESSSTFHTYTSDTVMLFLQPDKKFEKVYGIKWTASSVDCGKLQYIEQPKRENKDFKDDRTAYFTPNLEGNCTISVYGFWKQTNLQLIDSVTFIITDTISG